VRVVPAGVHHPLRRAHEIVRALLADGERVHVGAQEQHRARPAAAPQRPHHARLRDAGAHLVPRGAQALGGDAGGAVLLEAQLRVAVQVAAGADQQLALGVVHVSRSGMCG
jgi:hypothetical protein